MITFRKIIITIALTAFFFSGCSSENNSAVDFEKALKKDALISLREALVEDYTRLTIIRGSLYKFSMDVSKPLYLGIAVGSLQSLILSEEYEYKRFTKLENLPPQIKKDIIPQPMLNIIIKKRDVLSHAYSDILDPLAKQLDKGGTVSQEQKKAIAELIRLLDRIVSEYATLTKPDIDFNGKEAENAFFHLQEYHKEIQKLRLPEYQQEQW